jgi:predicted tellurium resistance membrane protein TerC
MQWITNPEIWVGLVTLTALEIVLGIDNIVFVSILTDLLPERQRLRAWRTGLGLAAICRIALLFSLAWVIGLTVPLFTVFGLEISLRDLILLGGGLFLLAKSTREIHEKLEGTEEHPGARVTPSFANVIAQILALDVVFSLDSVITAVGMVRQIGVMIAAVMIAVVIMILLAEPISGFVSRRPTVKMLALSFLLLIGATLIIEGLHQHIPRGYIYFAMGFSVFVEVLNLRLRPAGAPEPVHLRERYVAEKSPAGDAGRD